MLFMLAIYIFKILCVFLFVVYCVVTFLMVMYNARLEELKECITAKGEILKSNPLTIYVDEKLGVLTKKLSETEHPVKTLQNHISVLSLRREALRSEVIKQQEDYQMMLKNFTKELEGKKSLFSLVTVSPRKPRISCSPLQ
ncbi:uncharacterized protein LOC143356139 isoform X5 [Halictus rubicundus]|uniref:uncharacterized protein LOC143356139 isoform X5 n=1 Tax=Halictus rubicundus TaxID=77578 RepID=UPI00403606EB